MIEDHYDGRSFLKEVKKEGYLIWFVDLESTSDESLVTLDSYKTLYRDIHPRSIL